MVLILCIYIQHMHHQIELKLPLLSIIYCPENKSTERIQYILAKTKLERLSIILWHIVINSVDKLCFFELSIWETINHRMIVDTWFLLLTDKKTFSPSRSDRGWCPHHVIPAEHIASECTQNLLWHQHYQPTTSMII